MRASQNHINPFWKVAIIFLALHLIGVVACNDCPNQKYFRVIDLFIENSRLLDAATLSCEPIEANDHIAYNKLCIKMTTGVEYFSQQSFNPGSYFISSALACETLPPLHSETITNMRITSSANFIIADELTISSGASLNNEFSIEFEGGQQIPLQSYLQSPTSYPMEVPIYLFLNTQPFQNQLHQFNVYYELDSGNSFSATTEKVIITPE